MNLISHLIQRQLGLDPPLTRDLIIERDLPATMPDGTVLLADRWAPRTGGDKLPVALLRSPYGRGALITAGMVRPLAERGFQVILQSARGRSARAARSSRCATSARTAWRRSSGW